MEDEGQHARAQQLSLLGPWLFLVIQYVGAKLSPQLMEHYSRNFRGGSRDSRNGAMESCCRCVCLQISPRSCRDMKTESNLR